MNYNMNKKKNNINRRRMLQTFGSGFAVAGLTGIVDANSDRTRTIVAVKKGDTPVKKEKVP